MKPIRNITIVGFLLLGAIAHAQQSASDILTRVEKTYASTNGYKMKVDVTTLGNEGVISKQKAIVRKYKGDHVIDFQSYLTIIEGDKFLYINRDNRSIYFAEASENNQQTMDTESILGSLAEKWSKSVRIKHLTDTKAILSVQPDKGQYYSRILVYINLSDYTLEKIQYFFERTDIPYSRMDIQYSSIRLGRTKKAHGESIKDYIAINKNEIQGIGEYSGYRVFTNQ